MLTILHVDDSATSRMLFKAHLPQEVDLVVRDASDMNGALSVADEIQPDVVVLDYTMPDKNGIEVAQELIARGHRAKLVLLSANLQPSVVEEAKSLGFFKIVEKPVTAVKITKLIAEVEA